MKPHVLVLATFDMWFEYFGVGAGVVLAVSLAQVNGSVAVSLLPHAQSFQLTGSTSRAKVGRDVLPKTKAT
eukprot:2776813-Amphidinium_carterae.1